MPALRSCAANRTLSADPGRARTCRNARGTRTSGLVLSIMANIAAGGTQNSPLAPRSQVLRRERDATPGLDYHCNSPPSRRRRQSYFASRSKPSPKSGVTIVASCPRSQVERRPEIWGVGAMRAVFPRLCIIRTVAHKRHGMARTSPAIGRLANFLAAWAGVVGPAGFEPAT